MSHSKWLIAVLIVFLLSFSTVSAQVCDTYTNVRSPAPSNISIAGSSGLACFDFFEISGDADAIQLNFDISSGSVRLFYRSQSMTNFQQLAISSVGQGAATFVPTVLNDEPLVLGVQYLEATSGTVSAQALFFSGDPNVGSDDSDNDDPVTIPFIYIPEAGRNFTFQPAETLSIPIFIDCAGDIFVDISWLGFVNTTVTLRGNGRGTAYASANSETFSLQGATLEYRVTQQDLAESNAWNIQLTTTSGPPPEIDFFRVVTPDCSFVPVTGTISVPDTCPGILPSRMNISDVGRVTLGGIANNVRNGAGLNFERVGQLPPGEPFTVMDGPVCADGYAWYLVQSATVSGWTAEAGDEFWLEPLGTYARSATGAVLLQNGRGITNGAVMNDGEMQIEDYCGRYGYNVRTDETDWFCEQDDNRWTLLHVDFDRICRETYNRNDAFAVQLDRRGNVPAYNWRCYALSG